MDESLADAILDLLDAGERAELSIRKRSTGDVVLDYRDADVRLGREVSAIDLRLARIGADAVLVHALRAMREDLSAGPTRGAAE